VVRGRVGHVVMQTLAFKPVVVRARVGQRIVWRNDDSTRHNVTYVSGPRFHSSRPLLAPGATFSLRLAHPGTMRYVCTLHPWMTGTILVSR
jgi:plastocyanin